jgi:flagellin
MRELSVQSANDTNTASDRDNLQKEVVQLQEELNRIANTTSFNGKTLLDGSFSGKEFHVGANANQSISVSIGGATTETLGNERFTSASAALSMNDAVAANTNTNMGAQALTIEGSLGKTVPPITVGATDSAKSIADTVNTKSEDTGVTATAITKSQISNVNATGTVSFDLFGQNETDAAKVTAQISDVTDVTALASAINEQSGKTGITATLTDDKSGVVLKNTEGYDITIDNFTHSDVTKSMDVDGLNADGTAITGGTTQTIVGDGSTAATVGGSLVLDSNKGFTVDSDVDDDIVVGANVNSSSLKNISSVDIGTQAGSNDALSIIDGALAKISDSRASLGATQNRFSSTIANLENVSQNVSASRSRIQDADFAKESANLAKNQVLQQAGTAMLSQANASTQSVLSLLQ